jgi:PAS domain S-box-containing protein
MPRKLVIVALVIVGLHVCEVLILGTSPAGSLIANSLQMAACGTAAAMAFGAYRRARGVSRAFWIFVGLGMAMWGVANLGWIYYETLRHTEPPVDSVVGFLFDTQCAFFAMAVLLDQDKDSPNLDAESVLDFIQIAIVFFFIYLGLYYVPAQHFDEHSAALRHVWLEITEDSVLVALALIQLALARTRQVRRLYGGFAAYLLFYTACGAFNDYIQTIETTPTGTFYDLSWTIPMLAGAFWAASWQPEPASQTVRPVRRKTFGELMLTNATFTLAPLIVLVQISQLGTEWRVVRFSFLGISIVCYAARLGISQYREARSAETARRHTLAMDSAINGMAIIDVDGKHSYANASFARMMGYPSPQAIIGRHWKEVYSRQDVEAVERKIRDSLKEQGKWFGPLTVRHADGREVPMEMAVTVLPDGGVVCVSRDITQRLSAQRGLAEAEAKYRALVEHVSAISYIAELGMDGQWIYVSPQVEAILGFSAEEWLKDSRGWMRHVHPEDHGIIEAAEAASQRGERYQVEYRLTRKDGRVIWVSDTAVVVHEHDAHPLMEGIILDITERKQLEGQLQQSRRMEAVGRLAGGIAHDFNNLLTVIKGYAELALTRAKAQPELRTDIERIADASERAAALVRQLLAFSRRQVLKPKVLDLNGIVVGLDKLLRRLMNEDIEMVTLVGKEIGTIKADPGQVEQVIMNLVVNARDAMPNGGRLTIETANVDLDPAYCGDHATVRPGRYVMLAVTDTGIGMDADTVAHIFEPFYTTKESGRGTGLGLSTVYGIVKQSGGYIWVYSEPGKGTAFKVYLPRVDEPAEALSTGRAAGASRRGTETILLVEDDAQVRELTRTVLAAQGYFIIEAASPDDAERICRSEGAEIHLLLTDVTMPGISGRELAKRLSVRLPRMRVLYMSGYTFNIMARGGTLEHGVAFLQKPFTPSVLVEKVREVLDAGVPAR